MKAITERAHVRQAASSGVQVTIHPLFSRPGDQGECPVEYAVVAVRVRGVKQHVVPNVALQAEKISVSAGMPAYQFQSGVVSHRVSVHAAPNVAVLADTAMEATLVRLVIPAGKEGLRH